MDFAQKLITENGKLAPVPMNIFLFLVYHPDWYGVIGLDDKTCSQVVCKSCPPYAAGFTGAWFESDNFLTACWLNQQGLMVTPEQVAAAVPGVAAHNEQGPVEGSIL